MGSAALLTLLAGPAVADTVKIGFVTTLTTPVAVIGKDMRDAVDLAVEHIGGKMGNLDVEIVYADDEFNSQKGKQATERLVLSDKVDIVAGYIWSNVLLASAPVVLGEGKILISANAGPSPLAGAQCNENFFNIAWQNDQTPMALGELLNQQGVKSLYLVAPNYAAGQNMVAGVERTFKGKVVGKDLTKWGQDAQRDWSAELDEGQGIGQARRCIFAFYPGTGRWRPSSSSTSRRDSPGHDAAVFGVSRWTRSALPQAPGAPAWKGVLGYHDDPVLGAGSGQCNEQEVRGGFSSQIWSLPVLLCSPEL